MAHPEKHFYTEGEKGMLIRDRLPKVFTVFEQYGLDARLVGSLGRYASIDQDPPVFSSPNHGGIKDIDVIFTSPDKTRVEEALSAARAEAYPCKVDNGLGGVVQFNEKAVTLVYKNIAVPVDSSIFEKRRGHILGTVVSTFNPRTLFYLHEFNGLNPKLFSDLLAFSRLIREREDLLPENMFAPFHEIRRLRKQIYPGEVKIDKIRRSYYRAVPDRIRRKISPVTRPASHLLERILLD
jgi:hypothetical protein